LDPRLDRQCPDIWMEDLELRARRYFDKYGIVRDVMQITCSRWWR
jgi:hypothetical protein